MLPAVPDADAMSEPTPSSEDVRAAWDANAAYWDEHMEAGETWQQSLIEPAVERVLRLEPGERVLEIACGNGEFARRMASLGATVLATDFSEPMIERARARGGGVEYLVADATDEAALLALGDPGSFDAVVCNMALMDMREIEPMARAAATLLHPGGRLLLSTVHPAFNGSSTTRVVEQRDDERGVVRTYAVKVTGYSRPSTGQGVALEGQPVVHWYFDRSLSDVLRPFFACGFVLDALEEPVMPPERVRPGTPEAVFAEVPPVLVARLRPLTSGHPPVAPPG
jgi:2-polyprenyl-3-methyl-5-hydroxy-6-metoxy-1,4-benzoquinol methylase